MIIGRAEEGSEVPQRRHEVAPKHLSERPSWSDPVKSLAIFIPLEAQSDLPRATHRGRSHLTPLSERPPKATPRGRSRLYGETTRSEARSDLSERPTEVAPEGRSDLSERLVGATCRGRSASIVGSIPILLKALLVISLCTFYISKTYVLNILGSQQAEDLLDLLRNTQKNSLEKFISWILIVMFLCYC